jgi:hypothetical protein
VEHSKDDIANHQLKKMYEICWKNPLKSEQIHIAQKDTTTLPQPGTLWMMIYIVAAVIGKW